jgi:hypothetical protein
MKSTIGERLLWRDGDFKLSQCAFCVHKAPSAATCAAFPGGIPLPILRNQADHRRPLYGDHKVRFESAGGDADAYLRATGLPPAAV